MHGLGQGLLLSGPRCLHPINGGTKNCRNSLDFGVGSCSAGGWLSNHEQILSPPPLLSPTFLNYAMGIMIHLIIY